nr:glycine/betaine ABC transporter substrate-binding protein [Rubrobacteraceae bacterium]
MRKTRANLPRLLGLVAVLAFVAAGCGGGGGSASEAADLSGAELTVGSKEFTEQLILGQITLQALEAAGATVNDQIGLAGTVAARKALESGEIDMYWEYTGTGWINFLGHTKPIPDSQKQFEAVAKEDLAKNDIKWLSPPAPANNTYTM